MNFAQQLKTHRERLGLTQAELASFLEVSPRAVWQWEKGKLPHILTQEAALARLSKADALHALAGYNTCMGQTTGPASIIAHNE